MKQAARRGLRAPIAVVSSLSRLLSHVQQSRLARRWQYSVRIPSTYRPSLLQNPAGSEAIPERGTATTAGSACPLWHYRHLITQRFPKRRWQCLARTPGRPNPLPLSFAEVPAHGIEKRGDRYGLGNIGLATALAD